MRACPFACRPGTDVGAQRHAPLRRCPMSCPILWTNGHENPIPSLPVIRESTRSPQRRGEHGGNRAGPRAPHALPAIAPSITGLSRKPRSMSCLERDGPSHRISTGFRSLNATSCNDLLADYPDSEVQERLRTRQVSSSRMPPEWLHWPNWSVNFDGANHLRQKAQEMPKTRPAMSESGGGQVWSAFPQKNHGKRFNCPKIVWRNRCRFFLGWEAGVPEVGYPSPLWVCSSPIAGVRLVPANRGFHCGDLPSSSVPGCKTMRNYYWQVAYRSFMTDNPVLGARH